MRLTHGTINSEKLLKYYKLGINRLSIGLQSTSNRLLKSIGRIHTYEQFLETYKMAREVGFKNINVDLMLGLPGQTMVDLQDSLEKIVGEMEIINTKNPNIISKPEHISVYSLILEENTKLYDRAQKGELKLPCDEEERKMYWYVKQYLEKCGYKHYEISNFALPNYMALHNTNCWEQKEYIGVGAGASSFLNEKRYTNMPKIYDYINHNERILEEVLDKKSKMQEYVMLGLRKIEGINMDEFKKQFDRDFFTEFGEEYKKLHNEGLILLKNGYVKLSEKGIDLANLVWQEFV